MPVSLAWSIVRREIISAEKEGKLRYIGIEFFGGEPLLRFDLIREIVERTGKLDSNMRVFFYLPSNGSLLTPDVRQWFSENREKIAIQLSYDGGNDSQLANRHREVDSALEFCHSTWPLYPFKMTITRDSLPSLCQDIKGCIERKIRIVPEMAFEQPWSDKDCEVFAHQLDELSKYYLQTGQKEAFMLNQMFRGIEDSSYPQTLRCGLARDIISYDVDGLQYTCPSFMPLVTGEQKMKPSFLVSPWDESFADDPMCRYCPIRHWCGTCYAHNALRRGHPHTRDHSRCRLMLTWASKTLEYQMTLQSVKLHKEKSMEVARLLKDLVRIYKKVHSALQDGIPEPSEEGVPQKTSSPQTWADAQRAMASAKSGDTETLTAWLKRGGNPNTSFQYGETLLMQAAAFEQIDIMKLLLSCGADIDQRNLLGENALVQAARFGKEKAFFYLLSQGLELPRAEDMGGRSVLMFAARGGNSAVFEYCFNHGRKEAVVDDNGIHLITYAIKGGNTTICSKVMNAENWDNLPDDFVVQNLTKKHLSNLFE